MQQLEALEAECDRLRRDIEMKDEALDCARRIWEQERDRLRAEIERLLKHDGDAIAVCDSYAAENQQFSDTIETLRATPKADNNP